MKSPKLNMDDWEIVEKESDSKKPVFNMEDWEVIHPETNKNESFNTKLPRNIAVGLAQGGHNLLNTPHDVAENIGQQGQQFGESINKSLPLEKYGVQSPSSNVNFAQNIPFQEEKNFAQMLGQQGQPTFGDIAIQKGAQFLPETLLAMNALRSMNLLPQMPHLTRKGASRSLQQARELGKQRGVNNLQVNPALIENTRQFLPQTLAHKNLVEDALMGDYNALFGLQSDIGREAAKDARSIFSSAERRHGRAGLMTRDDLLNEIHNALQSQGHHDISDLLRKGQNEYRRFIKFRPYRNALIGAGTALAIPKNALTTLVKKMVMHKSQ